MNWQEFINTLPHNDIGQIEFDDGTIISESDFSDRYEQYFDNSIDSLINCEKATEGWKIIFNNLQQ